MIHPIPLEKKEITIAMIIVEPLKEVMEKKPIKAKKHHAVNIKVVLKDLHVVKMIEVPLEIQKLQEVKTSVR